MKNILSLALILLFAKYGYAQSIEIKTVDKFTQKPISAVSIEISKANNILHKTLADSTVTINNLPIGLVEIQVSKSGYNTQIIKEISINTVKTNFITVNLEPTVKNLSEVIITGTSPNLSGALMNIQSLTQEQILRFPATFMDPARLVFLMPGVTNINDQANAMSIRGNAPENMQWRLEGVEIVNPNHLSNAGTFSDKPTQAGGGTNILSAQMLGHMNFLSGAFPAEYANTTAGVMDMRFRVGNNKKNEYVLQAGLIGIDLAAEGPINKTKGSSFLVNYRYSFTGILGSMGIDFGGEKIGFQDLSFNLNFPTKNKGTFNVFFMGGNSYNKFKPDADSTKWETDKDFSKIDFTSKMGLIGIKHTKSIFKKWHINTVLANSGLQNLRNEQTATLPNYNINYDYSAKNLVSFSSILSGKIIRNLYLKTGINLSHTFVEYNIINSDTKYFSYSGVIVQPFIKFSNSSTQKLSYNLGLQGVYYSLGIAAFLEPRLAVAYKIGKNTKLKAAYGLYSNQSLNRLSYYNGYTPLRSLQLDLGLLKQINQNSEFSANIYYQKLFNQPYSKSQYSSLLNGADNADFIMEVTKNITSGRNYGIELNYKKLLNNGYFALINGTLYKSVFLAFDKKYYPTRYSGNHIVNFTIGKEWQKTNNKTIGINLRSAWIGGFRDYDIDLGNSIYNKTTVYNYTKPLIIKNPDYFRNDLRVYFRKSKSKIARTVSIDIQNLTNHQNISYKKYDAFTSSVRTVYQLGMIPMLNYRIEF